MYLPGMRSSNLSAESVAKTALFGDKAERESVYQTALLVDKAEAGSVTG